MSNDTCILLVNLEETLANEINYDLKIIGYQGVTVPKLQQAMSEVKVRQPQMIILDRSLTGLAGIKFCREVRATGNRVLILMLLMEETLEERIACLDAGADDYLLLPYHSKDFLRLVQFYLQPVNLPKEHLRFADLMLDLSSRCLLINEQVIDLTMKEFELLKYLMSHPGEVLSRQRILENVWGYDFGGESNVIEVYIRYLRLKLEAEGQKRIIQTVRGVGYVLRDS